jgi:orotidine 5'-phosphate decarboxylase subfamily 2
MTAAERDGSPGANAATVPFRVRLDRDSDDLGTLLCVGLDPAPGTFEGSAADHCRRLVDATIDAAVAFKPNSAFFEAIGLDGMEQLARVIQHIDDERIVILDAKRGDIGSTAAAYARAAFEVLGARAVTVSPYLGGDSVAAFTRFADRGAFVLCHTSNPGATDLQTLESGGEPLYLHVARRAREWDALGNVGLVVGATYPDAIHAVRQVADLPLLVPGVGAQGGDVGEAVRAGLDASGRGLVVNSSREIARSSDPREAALRLRDELNAARRRAG